ncbi:fibronectin type III domain-containing protein [Echinicola vietnamensis]|uniref:Putative phosphohydrolase n=1 Tax=Echinicola vietnamensis (strain DSM 17526 / LMG 23754 / KMM 6221) TaxID=926556 RepID=L0G1G5_ECHVK|nr:fibronectin type III domain-containing protein [Echinicola vietnamensis]AGA80024.1 putative phosphohydrolase [Echinicola vietnamensis DSM 17526]
MMKYHFPYVMKAALALLSIIISMPSLAQQIDIQPYLQDVTPHSAVVMWQTDFGDESTVEWGETVDLGNTSQGESLDVNFTEARVHEVRVEGLKKFTTYYYRVRTGDAVSDVFQFKTPPFASDHRSFNMIAMSDMQIDGNAPEKFREVVNDGILAYLDDQFEGNVPENLGLVLIPGDLVQNGATYHQWKDHFFDPAKDLFSQVPVYPVLGNHENQSVFYFKYFSLPKNGSPEYAENWWYKDYGNIRVLGLNSNVEDGIGGSKYQLAWLDKVLAETAGIDEIDFVFAQMHHPHKSELWIPGESDFSGEVVHKLEAFTEKTGKPSVHFFGHTHGYSRGQSKDHKHLWVNVASAGGAIDNWGEFEGRDYDEFTVTQDEYGFVMVEVDANPSNPNFTVKRISRGNQYHARNNELTDSITVWKYEQKPQPPQGIYPKNEQVSPKGLVLKASDFSSDRKSAIHAASNWQISTDKDFSKPLMDSWKQHENWYFNENQQKDDDLRDEEVFKLLKPRTTYYWRVRYRDQNLNWSDWSSICSFEVLIEKRSPQHEPGE